ncbi:sugar transferase [Radiobacillus kanasensis]|uniref:sugar transferase n=1 Tax=Radiobacillus kanasensis TaxID=2844358 RepID=UPI001E455A01|nr:sugar transferase [Radiobacillus kanasensis]UFT98853.1 sugar transferase [Radiobacillus kanasensis]
MAKRLLDIICSIFFLVLFFPLFIIVPVMIKIMSKGPVFFKQERIGKDGNAFQMLKFRSMHVNNDSSLHQQYVQHWIRESLNTTQIKSGEVVYKITNDSRIIPFIGKIIRKTSIDEIPQFINVLKGEMSIVGPRPALKYEVDKYKAWHKERLRGLPGITGLWQVSGRNTLTFNEMVELDNYYLRNQSVWLDIKIILKTPLAMFLGNGF